MNKHIYFFIRDSDALTDCVFFIFLANVLMKFMRCVQQLIMKEAKELLPQEMCQEDSCMFVTNIKSFAKETVSSKAAEFSTNWHGSTVINFVMLSKAYKRTNIGRIKVTLVEKFYMNGF